MLCVSMGPASTRLNGHDDRDFNVDSVWLRKYRSLGDGLPSASNRSQAFFSSISSGAGILWLAQHKKSASTAFRAMPDDALWCAMSETRKIVAILVSDVVGYSDWPARTKIEPWRDCARCAAI